MYELSILCPEAQVEILSEALEALDALSVSVEDADAATPAEQALFGEPDMPPPAAGWQRSVVKALFALEAVATESNHTLAEQDFFAECKVLSCTEVPDQDWVRLTQSQFAPVEITPEFWIVPTWHDKPAGALNVITLDPGLAFGTGTHPTTRMCLRWIATHPEHCRKQRVLDYGCGSGILAIGAALYGAAQIDAVDIDEAAVQSTKDNAAANGVSLQAGLPDILPQGTGSYPVVLANILATPLKVLAPLLCGHVAAGGHLVLAGILERQEAELQEAYAPFVKLSVADREDGWILMTAHKA
jgi:ribosomal protein L11 methyltransferase